MEAVSHQIEEYLEAIGKLEERGERVTTSSLARERQVSAPSVTGMLARLADRGLVSYRPRGDIVLTEAGRNLARTVMRRHRLWERFLHDILGIQWDRVHGEACKLEHATSPDVERELARAVGDSPTCPHGYAIPDQGLGERPTATSLLSTLKAPQSVRVVRVRDDDDSLLRQLGEMGIKPGVVIQVDPPASAGGGILIHRGTTIHSVSVEAAGAITVAPAEPNGDRRTAALPQLSPGETGLVDSIGGGRSFRSRCLALGFTPGTPISVIQNGRAGPLIVRVRDTRVALGRGEAQRIEVVRVTVPDAPGG